MSEAWTTWSHPDPLPQGPGTFAWRSAPSELLHPARGSRWRITGADMATSAVELDIELRSFSGAYAVRAVHTGPLKVREHTHDWPSLTLHLTGAYTEVGEWGETLIDCPGAALHPPGEPHWNRVMPQGMEAIAIHFDPAWLKAGGLVFRLDRSRFWIGGRVGAAARRLAHGLENPGQTEAQASQALSDFLALALADSSISFRPPWLDTVRHALERPAAPSTLQLARDLGLHPAWLARAYRAAVGEGVADTLRRRRVERAAALLRRSDGPLAALALDAGFCDQSHMNRDFRRLMGRTPAQVRNERTLLSCA